MLPMMISALRRLAHRLFRLVHIIRHIAKLLLPAFRPFGLRRRKPPRIAVRAAYGFRRQAKPEWVRHEVIRLKALMPSAGCRHIAEVFNRIYMARRKESVSKSYVSYTVRNHRYEITVLRRKLKHSIPRPMPVNQTWAIDLSGKGDTFGHNHHILGIIDHGSRRLLELATPDNKNAWTLLGHLYLCIGEYGRPQGLRTDCGRVAAQQRGTHRRTPCGYNEAVFKSFVFRTGLLLAGIRQQFTTPGCPWMNGRIERLFGTLKTHLDRVKIDGRETLAGLLEEFASWYNAVRPHQNLGGLTPNEAWRGIDPYARAPRSVQWFEGWEGMLRGVYLRY